MKKTVYLGVLTTLLSSLLVAQETVNTSCVESISHVNWNTKEFVSNLKLDMKTAGLELPVGRNSAERLINTKAPSLIKILF